MSVSLWERCTLVSIDQALLFTVQGSSGIVQGLIAAKALLSAHASLC